VATLFDTLFASDLDLRTQMEIHREPSQINQLLTELQYEQKRKLWIENLNNKNTYWAFFYNTFATHFWTYQYFYIKPAALGRLRTYDM
jgi:hypothetical protein